MKVRPILLLILALMASLACSLTTPVDDDQAGAFQSVPAADEIDLEQPAKASPVQTSPVPIPTQTTQSCNVTAEVLHLRDCAGLDCAVIDWLVQGHQLIILATSGDWLQVQTRAGQIGWVHSRYCGGQP